MSGLIWLTVWCASGGLVGGAIGLRSGHLGTGLLLGTFCGVLGWVLLLGAAPRPRVTAAVAAVAVEPTSSLTVKSSAEVVASSSNPLPPLSWVMPHQGVPFAAH